VEALSALARIAKEGNRHRRASGRILKSVRIETLVIRTDFAVPAQSEVHRQILANAPVVLYVGGVLRDRHGCVLSRDRSRKLNGIFQIRDGGWIFRIEKLIRAERPGALIVRHLIVGEWDVAVVE